MSIRISNRPTLIPASWCATRSSLLWAAFLALPAGTLPAQSKPSAPDLILTSGKIFTADSANPWAEALAIRGQRIVAVGTTDAVTRLAGGIALFFDFRGDQGADGGPSLGRYDLGFPNGLGGKLEGQVLRRHLLR